MCAVRTHVRTILTALTLAVLAAPAGAATHSRVLDRASLSDPQICGDTPTCATPAVATHSRHGTHIAAVAVSTTARARVHRHHLRTHVQGVPRLTAAHAGPHSPLPRPTRPVPAHRAPAPATPRYDGGKTAHNRYRSISGSVAFAPPASGKRDGSAMRLGTRSETFVPDPLGRLDLSRGPPRGEPSTTLASFSSTRRAAPHRTVNSPVRFAHPAARENSFAILRDPFAATDPSSTLPRRAAGSLAFASVARSEVSPAGSAGASASPLCSNRAGFADAALPRALTRSGVRRREGTAPHLHRPSNPGGLS